jgi:hypothetical protein
VNAEIQPMAEKTADRLRDQFLVTLRELDRRRQRAMDVRGLLRENRRALVAAGAGLAAVIVVVVGTSIALRRFRDRRLPRRRLEALSRAWENPDRVAIDADRLRRRLGLVLTLVKIAAVAAGSGLVRRKFQRALPSGS